MSLAESFIPYTAFTDKEVSESIGHAAVIRKLGPSRFEGPVAAWASDREKFLGETVVPRHVYVMKLPKGKEHRVAWIYHEGSMETNEYFRMHRVVCDCSGEVDRAATIEEKEIIMRNCPAIQPVLEEHAASVNKALGIEDILVSLNHYPKAPLEEQRLERREIIREFVGCSVLDLLRHDYAYPRSWIANIESGWTLTGLVGKVYKLSEEDIEWAVEVLDEDKISIEGQFISLTQAEKDAVYAEQVFKEAARSLEDQMTA